MVKLINALILIVLLGSLALMTWQMAYAVVI